MSSIHRHLRAAGKITPSPQKRPKSSYIRFAAQQPNERWEADLTHWWLAEGAHVEILNWIDDHARYALASLLLVRRMFRSTTRMSPTRRCPASSSVLKDGRFTPPPLPALRSRAERSRKAGGGEMTVIHVSRDI